MQRSALPTGSRDAAGYRHRRQATRHSLTVVRSIATICPTRNRRLWRRRRKARCRLRRSRCRGYVPSDGRSTSSCARRERSPGRVPVHATMAATLFRRRSYASRRRSAPKAVVLTAREREVLMLVDDGLSTRRSPLSSTSRSPRSRITSITCSKSSTPVAEARPSLAYEVGAASPSRGAGPRNRILRFTPTPHLRLLRIQPGPSSADDQCGVTQIRGSVTPWITIQTSDPLSQTPAFRHSSRMAARPHSAEAASRS